MSQRQEKEKTPRKLYMSFQTQFGETEREWSMNVKAFGLAIKNKTKWHNKSLLGFQYPLCLLQSKRTCLLDSIGKLPHRQLKSLLGKNLRQYSPIEVWFVIALVAQAHNKFECLKACSHEPPLI